MSLRLVHRNVHRPRGRQEDRLELMARFGLLLKSYRGDFDYAQRLIASFNDHNPTHLTMYCVVPEDDLEIFASLASSTVAVLGEEPLNSYFTSEPVHGIRPGYINQEIVKLAFWEMGLVDDYFCIDSDAVFIRDITVTDFIAPDGFPYSVLVEDNELKVEPEYYNKYWQSREAAIREISDQVGVSDPVLRTCHGHQVFSFTVLRSFKDDFLTPRGWSYLDALRVAPYEFTWYNMWLQKTGVIPIHQREPLVKVFHHEAQHLEYILRGITEEDIARGYLALVINSNFSRDLGITPIHESKAESLSHYLSYGEFAGLLKAKLTRSGSRVRAALLKRSRAQS